MAPSSTPWTAYKIEELGRLWAAGYSARDIAHELGEGITRNAVLGKIDRLGLSRRRPPQQVKQVKPRAARRRPVFTAPSAPPAPEPPPPCEPVKKPRMRRLQLLQLGDGHCRWPVGDPHAHPFYFCAADRAAGEPYCAFHMRKAFAKPRGEK